MRARRPGGLTVSPISPFLSELQAACPAVRSVWLIGERATSATPHAPDSHIWDLVAFADAATLRRVRAAVHLHRPDVRLRIVTDGDHFAAAWGELPGPGSLLRWDWVQANEGEAFYSEASWREPVLAGRVQRTRRKALCLWQAAALSEES